MTTAGTVIADRRRRRGAPTLAGNANTASTSTDNTVTWDVTAPTVTINQAAGQADPTNTPPINFTVVVQRGGDRLRHRRRHRSAGTTGGTKTATVTGGGTTYNVAVTGMTTVGHGHRHRRGRRRDRPGRQHEHRLDSDRQHGT